MKIQESEINRCIIDAVMAAFMGRMKAIHSPESGVYWVYRTNCNPSRSEPDGAVAGVIFGDNHAEIYRQYSGVYQLRYDLEDPNYDVNELVIQISNIIK